MEPTLFKKMRGEPSQPSEAPYLSNVDHGLVRSWLQQAVEAFETFSDEYRRHFRESVIRGLDFEREETSEARLLERVERALDEYWAPLGRVIEQWQVAWYRDILADGTERARDCLIKIADSSKVGVLLYFDKVPMIRRCPYADMAFLGVPHRLVASPSPEDRDWMAIPHELGHYVYWSLGGTQFRQEHRRICQEAERRIRGSSVVKELDPAKQDAIVAMLLGWLEEIFADMVGTWLGGDAFVASLQGLVRRAAGCKEELKANDSIHPPFCVRPFVRQRMMELLGQPGQNDWEKLFGELGVERVGALRIDAPPLEEAEPDAIPVERLRALLYGDATVSFTVAQVQHAMEPLLLYLKEEFDAFLDSGPVGQRALAFSELRAMAGREGEAPHKPEYDVLLQPRILEGGQEHTHGCWRHSKWHPAFTHTHP